jgi:hypothetical protein
MIAPCKSLSDVFEDFGTSDEYRLIPLSVRTRFHLVVSWWPERDAAFPLANVNAAFAKTQRDRSARAMGWRAGNFTLVLLQTLVDYGIKSGALTKNRVRQVPKLLPPRQEPTSHRRPRDPIRGRIADTSVHNKAEKSGEWEF